jgi:membrane protein implicated in regulation of membrane protease activity
MQNNRLIPQVKPLNPSQEGIVERAISAQRRGRIAYGGSHWYAALLHHTSKEILSQGTIVKVVAIVGMTLLVTRADD